MQQKKVAPYPHFPTLPPSGVGERCPSSVNLCRNLTIFSLSLSLFLFAAATHLSAVFFVLLFLFLCFLYPGVAHTKLPALYTGCFFSLGLLYHKSQNTAKAPTTQASMCPTPFSPSPPPQYGWTLPCSPLYFRSFFYLSFSQKAKKIQKTKSRLISAISHTHIHSNTVIFFDNFCLYCIIVHCKHPRG